MDKIFDCKSFIDGITKQYDTQLAFEWREAGVMKSCSYQDFGRAVCDVAEQFFSGCQGKVIGIDASRNSYLLYVVSFAVRYAKAVAAMMNLDLPETEVLDYLERADASMLVYSEESKEFADHWSQSQSRMQISLDQIGSYLQAGTFEGGRIAESARSELYDAADGDDLADSEQGICGKKERSGTAPALILPTSGSSGISKCTVLSHLALRPRETKSGLRALCLHPSYHIANHYFVNQLLAGGSTVLVSDFRSGLDDLKKMKPNAVYCIPQFLDMLKKLVSRKRIDPELIKTIVSVGAPIPDETAAFFEEAGMELLNCYGATETSGAVTRAGSGQLLEIALWNDVRLSEASELLVKGDNLFSEYKGSPELTKEALEDGWYHTGDLAELLERDGKRYLRITGRCKNLIILSNGENVSPEAIEQAIQKCPDVEEILVYGENDRIAADIYPGKVPETERAERILRIEAFIRSYNEQVPGYRKIGKCYYLENSLPKTATGKIKRVLSREKEVSHDES